MPLFPFPRSHRAARPLLAGALLWALASLVAGPLSAAAQDASPAPGQGVALPTSGPLPEATPRDGGPLVVVASTGILADLVRQVGGARVDARSVLPANADPHSFEPAPGDVSAIEDADLLVRHGLGLDDWIDDLLDNADTEAAIVVATDGIETLASDEEGFEQGDPHVWFDPTRVETMVATIATGLAASDPDGASAYEARKAAYQQQLRDLDAAIQVAIETIPPERRKLVTNHDALAYFADRYGLTVVGTVIPGQETAAEPSAEDVANLLEVIEDEGVPAIFAENTTNAELAEELANEADVAIVDDLYTDSLGDPGSGADTYLGLMATDTRLIVEALR